MLSEPALVSTTRRSTGTGVRGFLTLPEVRWAALATGLFAVGAVLQLAGTPSPVWWVLYLACYAAGGWEPGLAGLTALRQRTLDVDLLMIVAALVAAAIGQVFDGALLIVIFATSGALEALATKRTEDSVRALLDLAPDQAVLLDADGDEQLVDAAALVIGDEVLVRPGERLPCDGEVLHGASEVDQATITGEPLPVFKGPGDEVFAGTLNGTGALRVKVNRHSGDWVVARIVALVEEASATKANTQLFIEKVEQRYSIGMVTVTVALFVVPLLLGADLSTTLLRAMTFMIVASPCAVVLATMPPLLSAIANAGRHGVLVKSAVVMEQLGQSDIAVFDKTGTLTQGTPRVTGIHVVPGSQITAGALLAFAAAAERPSEHPLAAAIVAEAHQQGLNLSTAEDFSSVPGRGVRALVAGRAVQVGAPTLLDGLGDQLVTEQASRVIAEAETEGATAVAVLLDELVAGVLVLSDRPRAHAREAVSALAALTGRSPLLLTGDNSGAAQRLADEVGITEVRARLLPHDKVSAVAELHAAGRHVLAIGDGINDSAMLAAADTGVALGTHGSDLALHTADVVLVRDDLATLGRVVALSRRARRVVVANLVIAGIVIAALVTWDLAGHLPLPLGVAGHEGSTVVVGLNGLRLLRARAWR
jgi:heavy metal translocating P-type ATPase